MRKLLALVVFVGVVAVGANMLLKGGLSSLTGLSADQQQLADLESDLKGVERDWKTAVRAAGLSGVETTAEAGAAIADLDRIEKKLVKLERSLDSDVARAKARTLHDRIDDLRAEMR